MLKFKVKVNKANNDINYYKITVPKKISEFLELNLGDSVIYNLHHDGKVSLTKDTDKRY
ncbi:MAG: hypothetical protein LBR15_02555 [Methanobrevibacter sp.]|jgi:bifunctional DNA-binding transcriptional regulator/antitoxin component of YhaV-PrlF toxin-antitoxin module|nr:hypothetical protein [Candidatus Methanovirga australis]